MITSKEHRLLVTMATNILFNLKQNPGHAITPHECRMFGDLQEKLDAAMRVRPRPKQSMAKRLFPENRRAS